MSFEAATKYLSDYNKSKREALDNKKGARWFTGGVTDLAMFKNTVCDRTDDRAEWNRLYTESLQATNGAAPTNGAEPTTAKRMRIELRIELLAGWYRDIRILFCVNDTCSPRGSLDYDRFELMRAYFRDRKVSALQGRLVT